MRGFIIKVKEKINAKRCVELDSLRGLAALSVFFGHALMMLYITNSIFLKAEKSILHIFWDGSAAVVLFFVLSGFVLGIPYFGDKPREIDYIPFIIKRIFRIYPAYYFALLVCILTKIFLYNRQGIMSFTPFVKQFWGWNTTDLTLVSIIKHLLMIGPKFSMGEIDPILWSLVVEMKISIFFPLFIILIKDFPSIKTEIAFLLSSILMFKIIGVNFLERITFFSPDVVHFSTMFIMGALLAKNRFRLFEYIKKAPKAINIFIFFSGIVLYTGRFSLEFLKISYSNYDYLISLGAAIIIVYVLAIPLRFSFLTRPSVKFLGDISYSFYLLHFPILLTCTSIIYPRCHYVIVSFVISLICSLIISYASYKYVEVPFQNIGRTFYPRVQELLIFRIRDSLGKVMGKYYKGRLFLKKKSDNGL